ncbi:MAG: sulfatase-like hydrolase/transferase, partial [Verrucomicrobiota bacterium]
GVGRFVAKLKELDQFENTLILFLSDNGASAESGVLGFTGNRGGDPAARTGTPDSYNSFGISGANLCDTPFRKYKAHTHEGGIATPLVAHWPGGIAEGLNGTITAAPGHVIDFLPTCLEMAGAKYPEEHGGEKVTPVAGRSLLPVFAGEEPDRPEGLFFEHQGNAAIRDGKWKLVRPHRGEWELYDLESDRTELNDLSNSQAKKVDELKAKWQDWADAVGVQPWPLKKKE